MDYVSSSRHNPNLGIFDLAQSTNHASIQMQAYKTEDGTVYQGLGGLQEEGWHAEHFERPAIHRLAASWCSGC